MAADVFQYTIRHRFVKWQFDEEPMTKFEFATNEKSAAFCQEIAQEMARLFGIPIEEAIGRLNLHWKDQPMFDDEDMVYHENEYFWANQIYFEDSPRWWTIPDPKPRRYP